VISKKFQPHFSVQHSTLDTLNTNKNHDNNKQNNFPHNIGITDNSDTDKPQNQKDQVWDKHDHNHNLQIYGSAVNDIINTATITPINKTPKIIINTYTKNLTTNPEPTVQYHTPNIRTGNDTPITDFFHITHNETNTPILKPQNSVEAIQLTENIYLNTPTITNPIPIPLHHPNKNTLHNNVNQSGSSKIFNDNTNTNEYFLSQKKQATNSSNRIVNLTPELEPLESVIMLQHTALENYIKELGNTCLEFTTVIEQKKESASKLTNDKRIPRSLRIKCELSTSPSYENNSDFIILKRELQEALNTFTTIGLNVMK
jgi:hypothetical protein